MSAYHSLPNAPRADSTAALTSSGQANTPDAKLQAKVADEYGRLPLSFEPNVGQLNSSDTKFVSRGRGYAFLVNANEAVLRLRRHPRHAASRGNRYRRPARSSDQIAATEAMVLDMRLVGANVAPKAVGVDELPGKVNYLKGRDRSEWKTDVSTYSKVKLENVYPGIDLVYYGNHQQLEYDFVVAPGADLKQIRLNLKSDAAKQVAPTIAPNGDLVIAGQNGEVKFHKPVVYQASENPAQPRVRVEGQFELSDGMVAFAVGPYDHQKPLVIDPVLQYATYLGGSNSECDDDWPTIAVDSAGNAYIAGETDSTDYPVLNAFQNDHAPNYDSDATLTKLNATGTALVYSTYLGGTLEDYSTGIAVDANGSAYVVGTTCSLDFPVTPGAAQTSFAGGCTTQNFVGDLFITKFAPSGSTLEYSTYLGGSNDDASGGIAVDSSGNAYVTGSTISTDLPVTPGVVQPTYGGAGTNNFGDAFAAKLNANGTAIVYCTYLGGSSDDFGSGIAVDQAGNAYIAGTTNSTDFPITAKAFQKTFGGAGQFAYGDAFVTKLNASATAYGYSSYLGGSDDDGASAIAVDKHGNAYIAGSTVSSNFPVTPTAFQIVYGGTGPLNYGDVFVSRVNSKGTALVYSTYIGADQDENPLAVTVDSKGGAWVVGFTSSDDFPTSPKGLQRIFGGLGTGLGDGFVLRVAPKGTSLTYSSFLGGSGDDGVGGVAVGPGGVYLSVWTTSPNMVVTQGAYDSTCGTDGTCNGGAGDNYVYKFKP